MTQESGWLRMTQDGSGWVEDGSWLLWFRIAPDGLDGSVWFSGRFRIVQDGSKWFRIIGKVRNRQRTFRGQIECNGFRSLDELCLDT
jgi:hypothetical protein